jgi:hypothetical protein
LLGGVDALLSDDLHFYAIHSQALKRTEIWGYFSKSRIAITALQRWEQHLEWVRISITIRIGTAR